MVMVMEQFQIILISTLSLQHTCLQATFPYSKPPPWSSGRGEDPGFDTKRH